MYYFVLLATILIILFGVINYLSISKNSEYYYVYSLQMLEFGVKKIANILINSKKKQTQINKFYSFLTTPDNHF